MTFIFKSIFYLIVASVSIMTTIGSLILLPFVWILMFLFPINNKEANPLELATDDELYDEVVENEPAKIKIENQDKQYAQPKKRDYRKEKGIAYEQHIGKSFEAKGDLVIYNGLIQDYEDGGVDLVAISPDGRILNLIQCKNWNYRTIEVEHIRKIYQKLRNHSFDFLHLSTEQIKTHLHTHKNDQTIREIISKARENKNHFTIRKTLYIASEKVVNLEVGKHLTMIKPNIFRYEDMKIVVERI